MSETKKNTFDELVSRLVAAGLENESSLKENTVLGREMNSGKWQEKQLQVSTTGQGKSDKFNCLNEICQKTKEEYEANKDKFNDDIGEFSFSCKLNTGEKLPSFPNIKELFSGNVVSLDHKPGEVLLIDIWATWCGPCQKPMQHNEDMLKKNEQAWKGKARIVAVSVDDDMDSIKQRVETKDWKRIEHLALGSWDGTHSLIKLFQVSGIPFVCLIDKQGTIDYIGHPSGCKLENKINELIAKDEQAAPKAGVVAAEGSETKSNTLDESSWGKFEKIIEGLIDEGEFQSFSVVAQKQRTWKNGKSVVSIRPLKINYKTKKLQKEASANYANKIVEGLSPSEYQIISYVDDPEEQLMNFTKYVDQLIKNSGFEGSPVVVQNQQFQILKDTEWKHPEKQLALPNIPYKGKQSYEKGKKFREDFNNYLEEVCNQNISPIEGLANRLPFRIVGNKFAGIHDLKKYGTDQLTNIEGGDGKAHIVVISVSNNSSKSHVCQIADWIKENKDTAILHVVHLDDEKPEFLNNLSKEENANVHIYKGDHQENPDLSVLEIRGLEHTLFVNKDNIVTSLGNFKQYHDLKSRCENAEYKGETVLSEEALKYLQGFSKSEQLKILLGVEKETDYNPQATLTYTLEEAGASKSAKKLKLTLKVRSTNKDHFKDLIARIKDIGGQVDEEYIEVLTVPEGKTCVTCNSQLNFPYYFYFTNNVHRCRGCAEKENKEAAKLARYDVNENAILVFQNGTQVDRKRMGKNIQPKTDEECGENSFCCNGCRGGSGGNARYICMGCRREPNGRGDYVDFCLNCAKKIIEGTPEEKKLIEDRNEDEGHKNNHPLLRVLYGVSGYYEF